MRHEPIHCRNAIEVIQSKIGCMYSMVAFGLVCGFLLGGYFIQVHENSFGSGTVPLDIFPGHPK